MPLRFTTIQAPNQEFIIAQVCDFVGEKLGLETEFVNDIPWEERARRLDAGQIEVAWICGLPYIERVNPDDQDDQDHQVHAIELLAAPVMAAPRYQDRPIYFSDVIVSRESEYQSFEDLRGAVWAYNEPHSHSGYNLTRCTLARMGAYRGFFGRAVQAGSHQRSIQMVLQGEIDAAAIDSTVLEIELAYDPGLSERLRVIAELGPSPIPPLVILKRLPPDLRADVRRVLLEMHMDQAGQRVLAAANMRRYALVTDADYDPIRTMTRDANLVQL
jgi:phosphonate transport system substrate-binding protein